MVENLPKNLEKEFEIEESDFKMVFDGRTSFDLYLKNSTGTLKLVGYNIPFLTCLKKIIYYRVDKKLTVTNLKTFLLTYKEVSEELDKTIKSALNV